MADDEDNTPQRRIDWIYVVLAIIALGALAWWWHSSRPGRLSLDTTPGKPEAAFVVAGTPPMLVIVDAVAARRDLHTHGDRLAAIDIATGKEVNHLVTTDRGYDCWPASAGRMWCEDTDANRVHLIAVPTFAAVADVDELVAKSGLGTIVGQKRRIDGDAVVVLLADGRGARVDPATLAVTLADAAGITGDVRGNTSCTRDKRVKRSGGDWLVFTGETRQQIAIEPAGEHGALPPASDATPFVDPHFVRVEDPDVVLVEHIPALDQPDAKKISRLDDQLHPTWTVDTGGDCQGAHLSGTTLVIATPVAKHRAMAVDLASGKVLWHFAF